MNYRLRSPFILPLHYQNTNPTVIGMTFLRSVPIPRQCILVIHLDSVKQHILRHESDVSCVFKQGRISYILHCFKGEILQLGIFNFFYSFAWSMPENGFLQILKQSDMQLLQGSII